MYLAKKKCGHLTIKTENGKKHISVYQYFKFDQNGDIKHITNILPKHNDWISGNFRLLSPIVGKRINDQLIKQEYEESLNKINISFPKKKDYQMLVKLEDKVFKYVYVKNKNHWEINSVSD